MESEEQEPNLFQQPAKRDYTLLRQIITWAIVLSVVALLGVYCYRSSAQQSALDTEKEREKKEKQDLEKQEANQRAETAIKSFHEFITTEFPGWTLEGDNLTDNDLSDDLTSILSPHEPIYFFVQLSRKSKSRVMRLGFINLKKADGTQYWAVYRPTAVSLGDIELQKVKEKEYKAGQENPPEPEPDYDPSYDR